MKPITRKVLHLDISSNATTNDVYYLIATLQIAFSTKSKTRTHFRSYSQALGTYCRYKTSINLNALKQGRTRHRVVSGSLRTENKGSGDMPIIRD